MIRERASCDALPAAEVPHQASRDWYNLYFCILLPKATSTEATMAVAVVAIDSPSGVLAKKLSARKIARFAADLGICKLKNNSNSFGPVLS